jgi:hypothetical protein
MARVPHRTARRRLRLAVAGAVVLTALTAATAGASVPPVATQAPEPTRLGTSPSIGTGPLSLNPPIPFWRRIVAAWVTRRDGVVACSDGVALSVATGAR